MPLVLRNNDHCKVELPNSSPGGFTGDTDDASNDGGKCCRSSRSHNRSAVPRTARRKRRQPRLRRPHRRALRPPALNLLPPPRRPCRRVRPTSSLQLGRSWRLQAQTGACSPQRRSDVRAPCNKHKNTATDDDCGQKQKAQIGFPRRLQTDGTVHSFIACHEFTESVCRRPNTEQGPTIVAHPPVSP
jgi:hypothetical protein